MSVPILELNKASYSFFDSNRETPILSNADLSIQEKQGFTVIGPSGAGKSVFLKILAGLYPLTKGEYFFLGKNWGSLPRGERKTYQDRLSMTFQRSGLFDSLSVYENLRFPLDEKKKGTSKDKDEKISDVLNRVGLLEYENSRIHELSGGMQKRLGIARALLLEPEVLLFDDPTAGLDPVTSRSILDLIIECTHKKVTVVLVTSDLNVAMAYSKETENSIGFLYKGKFEWTGKYTEIKKTTNPVVRQFVTGELKGPLHD